jgi:hypothetical protein
MKHCQPIGEIVISHYDSYIGLKVLYDEHVKYSGQFIKYGIYKLDAELSKHLDNLYTQKIIDELLFDHLIHAHAKTDTSSLYYSITVKGAALYQETDVYKKLKKKAEIEAGRLITEDELCLKYNKQTEIITLNFFASLGDENPFEN